MRYTLTIPLRGRGRSLIVSMSLDRPLGQDLEMYHIRLVDRDEDRTIGELLLTEEAKTAVMVAFSTFEGLEWADQVQIDED